MEPHGYFSNEWRRLVLKKQTLLLILAVLMAFALVMTGCTQQAAESDPQPTEAVEEATPAPEATEAPAPEATEAPAPEATEEPEAASDDPLQQAQDFLDDVNDEWNAIAEEYAPEIRTLSNGVKIQRTPTEYGIYGWMLQSDTISYNTYYLNADNRGCEACHTSLNETLQNSKYQHPAFWNDSLGVWTTVQQCLICHTYAPGYIAKNYDFGTLIHGIHYGNVAPAFDSEAFDGNCMSCHNMTADGQGIQLWDVVKYQKLLGMVDVENVQGNFSFEQDKVQQMSEVFSYDWMHSGYDNLRHALGKNGANVQPPQSMFDEWEISVHGLVNEPYTVKLPDLIAEAEAEGAVVTKISKMVCDWNAVGGGGITNVEITGIPLTWLIEKAGGASSDSITGVTFDRVDEGSFRCVAKEDFDMVYLVYKMGGEYLDGSQGYPVINWYEAVDAQSNIKQIVGYTVTDEDIDYASRIPCGWVNEDGSLLNRPNATILGVPDGLLIETGKPFTFEGYADAYNEKITTIEFSMDQGKTWTAYELGDTDVTKWVYWYFEWTPETDGSYVLTVRATTETGLVSTTYHQVMVTAKSDLEG